MSKKSIIALSITGILLIFGLVLFSTYRSTYDRDVNLRSKFKGQEGAIEANFDGMKKILHDEAKIPVMYANDVKDLYAKLADGRMSENGDGSLMKWIQERNPNFDVSLYKSLMDKIESLRKEFEYEQKKMLAIVEQHDNLRNEFWSSMFLGKDCKPFQIV